MNKKVFLFLALIFAVSFCRIFSSDRTIEDKIFFLFENTRKFHTEAASFFENASGFKPECFVITYETKENPFKMRRFFAADDFSEKKASSDFICTVPYYSIASIENGSYIRFAFAFSKSERDEMTFINDFLMKLLFDGKFNELAQSRRVLKKAAFFYPQRKSDTKILTEFIFIIVLVIVNILVMHSYLSSARKLKQRKDLQSENIALASRKIALQMVEKMQNEITDASTGLFTSDYIKSKIQEEIVRYQIFRKIFCVAIFVVPDTGNHGILKRISGIITENLNRNITSAYKGNGIFISFFPEKAKDDISIFVDLTSEKIDGIGVPVVTKIHEFKGQENFMMTLGV